jgi:eukaryotic-like serine/threonine-protein kinase
MRAANDQSAGHSDPHSRGDDDEIELDSAVEDTAASTSPVMGRGADAPPGGLRGGRQGDGLATSELRWRLAAVAGFLALFHLAFAVVKATGPASVLTASSDAPTWSLLLRAAVAGLVCSLLVSPLRLSRQQVRYVEGGLFGFEMLVLLAAQYLSAIDLIDRRDLVDAVAIQKNGVIRTLVLMICSGVFVPRAPAATARIAVTMAAAMILCHGVVLHHADTVNLDMDDVANHQIVMSNALFLIMGVALATLAAWVLRGRTADHDGAARVGPYRLLHKLDEGGTGEVYLAEHDFLKRRCALKIIRADDRDAAARFDREVQAAALLAHPNAITIFDSGHTDDGIPYCAMEYLPGLCAADIVRESGPMPASRAVYVGRQVCGALAEAHRLGFVHRDVSPANVFVSVLGGRCDVAKVLDFGAVGGLATAHDLAADGGIAGTPEYVAPEQAVAGRDIDGRADLYGLGALLYFLVTGVPPFQRDTPADVLRAHASEPVRPPRELRADLPADLEAVILRCLAKRPEDRYGDARALADALGACSCATQWDDTRAEDWWLEKSTLAADAAAGPSPQA